MTSPVLFDTSVYVGLEAGRPVDVGRVPGEGAVCVVTIAELLAGVHAATDIATRARRMATLDVATELDPLPVDAAVAQHWARLRASLGETGRRVNVNDLWIAAVAAANRLTVVTQDDDFDAIEAVGGPPVIRV